MKIKLSDILGLSNMSETCREYVSQTLAMTAFELFDILDIVNLQENKKKNKNT